MVTSILPLQLESVSVVKRGKTLIGPVDLTLGSAGLTMVMGPNGSGKTTLLKLMHGLERPRGGRLVWNVEPSVAQRNQAFVFQTPVMLRRSALANVEFPLRLRKMKQTQARSEARNWLKRINIDDLETLDAKMLSGGERQKLALARALAIAPQVLFLDEPTSNLDGQSTREIETLIKEAVASGVRVVMTTHDVGQARRLADELIFLYKGKVHEHQSASDFFSKPETEEAKAFLDGDIVE